MYRHWGLICALHSWIILYCIYSGKIPVLLLPLPSPIPDIIFPLVLGSETLNCCLTSNLQSSKYFYLQRENSGLIKLRLMKTSEVPNFLLVSSFIKIYFLGLNYPDSCISQMIPKKLYPTGPFLGTGLQLLGWIFPQMLAEHLLFTEWYSRIYRRWHIINYNSCLQTSCSLFNSLKTNAQHNKSAMLEQQPTCIRV